jgi:hypothetical protein
VKNYIANWISANIDAITSYCVGFTVVLSDGENIPVPGVLMQEG